MSSPKVWGAVPGEWDAFVSAGVMSDMLPYVADPDVPARPENPNEMTRRSWRPGTKMPGLIGRDGYGHGIRDWGNKRSELRDIDRWKADSRLGFCVVTRRLRAIDVDVEDAAEAEAIEGMIVEHFGLQPTRRRVNSNKFAVAIIVEGDLGKTVVHTRSGGLVEFLGNKQQFFAVGMHKSGVRYEWDGGAPSQFDTVSVSEYNAFIEAVAARFGTEITRERLNTNVVERSAVDVNDDMVQFLEEQGAIKLQADDGKVFIHCPFEHEHTSADADHTATVYFPAGLGGYADGHFRCQHAHCSARSKTEFEQALGYYKEQFAAVVAGEGGDDEAEDVPAPAFDRNLESGKILATIGNVMLALRTPAWLGVDIAHDEFRDEVMITAAGRREWRAFRDADYTRVRLRMADRGLPAGLELIKEGIGLRADETRIDSAILWLKHEVPAWDGVCRIEGYFPDYYGTEDTPYTRAVGAYTWTAMAARVLDPGHKVDMVPILSSGEGCRKSESIASMVPDRDFFAEIDLASKDDDLSRLMRGRLVAELGEMRGLRTREMGHLKAFITRRFENWVPKYKEFAVKFPRRLLFIGTTNETEFLSDQTGKRRWLPMAITRADVDAIERDRLQLWAEGRERFLAAGVAYEDAEELALGEHEKFEESHPWEHAIEAWLQEPADYAFGDEVVTNGQLRFQVEQVLVGALRVSPVQMTKAAKNQVGGILRKLGYERSQMRTESGRKWVFSAKSAIPYFLQV